MARLPIFKHILTVGDVAGLGGDKYSFKAPDIYGNIGSSLGVQKAPANDTTIYKGRLGTQDFSEGKAIKMKCRSETTDLAGKKRTRDFTIVTALTNVPNAFGRLPEKKITISGVGGIGATEWDIKTVRIPRHRRLS